MRPGRSEPVSGLTPALIAETDQRRAAAVETLNHLLDDVRRHREREPKTEKCDPLCVGGWPEHVDALTAHPGLLLDVLTVALNRLADGAEIPPAPEGL